MSMNVGQNYSFNSNRTQLIQVGDKKVKVKVSGGDKKTDLDIKVNDKGQIEISNDSTKDISVLFDTDIDLDIVVAKSNTCMNITTGSGDDKVEVKDGAKIKNIDTGKGDDIITVNANATVNEIDAFKYRYHDGACAS